MGSALNTPAENLKRFRLIQRTKSPTCCKVVMEVQYLNFGDKTEAELAKGTEQEYADYLSNQPIPPVFSCNTCGAEKPIPRLTWPERSREETPTKAEGKKTPVAEGEGIALTGKERAALRTLINNCAKAEGEDVIGLFMKHGLFLHFPGDGAGIVKLADKFE